MILLYGAEVWVDALYLHTYRTQLATVQRGGALRITSAYRMVYEVVVLVIEGITLMDLLAKVHKKVFDWKASEIDPEEAHKQHRIHTMDK